MKYKKISFVNQPYEYKEEKEEKEYKSPLEKHINKKKKPDKSRGHRPLTNPENRPQAELHKYRILANPADKLFVSV